MGVNLLYPGFETYCARTQHLERRVLRCEKMSQTTMFPIQNIRQHTARAKVDEGE